MKALLLALLLASPLFAQAATPDHPTDAKKSDWRDVPFLGWKFVDTATLAIPDNSWRLWPDTKATWKDDTIYLPDDVKLATLPVNPPTGGWPVLSATTGIPVTLPSTVEQHYWGKFALRPYTRYEYTYGGRDPEVQNGNYEGVSWWWTNVKIPASFTGKLALLHIRGARQRAEVYVNQKLVGYDIIEETSFDSDITSALIPGQVNQIAIRITNPGGWMDWQDFQSITWGGATFHRSHGFGGLDRAITITAHDAVYLQDTWVLNTPKPRTITAHATVTNTTASSQTGTLRFFVLGQKSGGPLATTDVPVTIPANSSQDFDTEITCPTAELWDLATPTLYTLQTHLEIPGDKRLSDNAERDFGFRWFEPRGMGQQAGLYLNDRRVRLFTAISWGYWGLNGLWPTPELAEKEVRDAKQLNLNMLNFHRDIGKEEVLADQDRLGLLRYMEPGGGKFALGRQLNNNSPATKGPIDISGNGGEPSDFSQHYMVAKILRMVRQFRSHPSLVIEMIQNETEPDLHDPHLFNLLRQMHALDPSRVIATKSGISPLHQAWFPPYAADPMVDDGTGYSGWYDHHTVGGPGVWQDKMYENPDKFTHQSDDRREIVDWGEMLGAAVADNHPQMIAQIKAHGGDSYDLADHQEIEAAYHQFLDKWGFRKAFPTDDIFFRDLGNKMYEFWGRVIETARLSEANDILSISGWESTAIENHSGLVDNLRNFKGDPKLIAPRLAPLLPIAKPRASILNVGDTTTLDLTLLNETGHAATGDVKLTLTDPTGKTSDLGTFPAPAYVQDQFVYPIKTGIVTPPLSVPGKYSLTTALGTAKNSETLIVVSSIAALPSAHIGAIGDIAETTRQLKGFKSLTVESYHDGASYDLIINAARGNGRVVHFDDGTPAKNTDDPALYKASIRGKAKQVHLHFDGLTPGTAKVTLYFCDQESREVGKRRFDVQINDKVVLHDFDIYAEAGGPNIALPKTFDIDAPQGVIDITVPPGSKGEALFNAIKIEAGGKTIGVVCGGESYTDKSGLTWNPYNESNALPASLLDQVKRGTPMLILAGDEAGADAAGHQLAEAGAIKYAGTVSTSRASWMGGWVFVRKHPLYDGLPVNEVMKGDYQAPVDACYGVLVDGPGLEIIAAYSRDHARQIGAVTFTTHLGKGQVVYQGLLGMHPIMQHRWLGNALTYLLSNMPPSKRPE